MRKWLAIACGVVITLGVGVFIALQIVFLLPYSTHPFHDSKWELLHAKVDDLEDVMRTQEAQINSIVTILEQHREELKKLHVVSVTSTLSGDRLPTDTLLIMKVKEVRP